MLIVKGMPILPNKGEYDMQIGMTGLKRPKVGGKGKRYRLPYKMPGPFGLTAQGWIGKKDHLKQIDNEAWTRKTIPNAKNLEQYRELCKELKQKTFISAIKNEAAKKRPRERLSKNQILDKPKCYRLNKSEIRRRVLSMCGTLLHSRIIRKKNQSTVMFFFTITFKQGTEESVCYDLLNLWLTQLRQQRKIKSYLWVAEKTKKGTTHFHMLVPHYMNVKAANAIMRQSIQGYIKKGMITGWNYADAARYNGIDIAKNRNTKRVVNFAQQKSSKALHKYITKYVSKNEAQYNRQPWRCSRDWGLLVQAINVTTAFAKQLMPCPEAVLRKGKFENEFIEFWGWLSGPPEQVSNHLADINYFILEWFHQTGDHYFFSLN